MFGQVPKSVGGVMAGPWIESHQDLGDHPKTIKLAHLLGVSAVTAVGHLHYLWWWALTYAENGDLSDFDDFDIARAARWEGDPVVFAGALVECGPGRKSGFVDRSDKALHDWWDYAGRLVERRRKDRERKAKSRGGSATSEGVRGTSDGSPTDGAGNPAVPNLTEPNPTKDQTHVAASGDREPPATLALAVPEPAVKKRRKGKRPLPDDWTPTDKHRALGLERGIDVDSEAQRFRDYCAAHAKTYADHDAAFRNWLTSDLQQQRASPARNGDGREFLTAGEQRSRRNAQNRTNTVAALVAKGVLPQHGH